MNTAAQEAGEGSHGHPDRESIAALLVLAGRTAALPVAVVGLFSGIPLLLAIPVCLWGALKALVAGTAWHLPHYLAEGCLLLAFFGYAGFVLVPLEWISGRRFRWVCGVGGILALGSIKPTWDLYKEQLSLVREMPSFAPSPLPGYVLVALVYAYIPLMLAIRCRNSSA